MEKAADRVYRPRVLLELPEGHASLVTVGVRVRGGR